MEKSKEKEKQHKWINEKKEKTERERKGDSNKRIIAKK